MGYCGNKFTWWNGRHGQDYVYERLDHGVCSIEWRLNFPNSKIRHISFTNSDHEALLVDIQPRGPRNAKPPKRFRFENAWLQMEGCEDVIRLAWSTPQSGYPMFQVCQKIKACRVALLRWSNARTRPTKDRLDQLRQLVSATESNCQMNPMDATAIKDRQNARTSLNDFLAMEESYWKQPSRVSWLK